MKIQNIRWNLLALGAFAALMSTSAHAVWTFDIGTSGSTLTNAQVTNITAKSPFDSVPGTDPTVTLSGVTATNTNGVVGGNWSSTSLVSWGGSGVGIQQAGEGNPQHAVDNSGKTEAVLMNFSSSVILSSIGLGWTSNGTSENVAVDLSVFRWVGTGTPPDLVGKSATANSGWELVGNYGDMVVDKTADPGYNKINTGTANGTGAAGAGQKGSSWWLISAYNTGFGTAKESRGSLDNSNDFFKLFAVAGTTCVTGQDCGPKKLPEPATLALTSVALLGMVGLRRRKN
ncbi:exosortase-dependent surface protein XDP1 [Roseateles sp. DC23W]|uniref:Exosortase-dependent surface protein XDP1 n=1 Tax=Pelomonas dachongensis TaxID=3299029 RepID=A0ABW7EUI1_9BURK